MNKNSAAVPVPQPGGKLYYEVQDRINFLHELYPERCEVRSQLDKTFALQNNPADTCAYYAWVIIYTKEGEPRRFDGWAYEFKDNQHSPVNREAHIENCETSAIGRALEHAGIVGDAENPSYEAMLKTGAFTENASAQPMSQEAEIDKRRQTGEFKGKNRGDANKPASDKQKQYMKSLGLKFDDSISSAAASDLIEQKKEKKGASTDSTPPKPETTPPPSTPPTTEQPNYKDDPETKDMRLQVVSFVIDHSEFINAAFGSTDTFWKAVMTRYNAKNSAVMPAVSWKNLRDGCLAAANQKNEETGVLEIQTFLEYTPPTP